MAATIIYRFLLLLLLTTNIAFSQQIVLPIEVLGEQGIVKNVNFRMD